MIIIIYLMNNVNIEKLSAAAKFDRIYQKKVLLEEVTRKSISMSRLRPLKETKVEQYVMESIYNYN